MKNIKIIFLTVTSSFLINSCQDFLNIEPSDALPTENIFTDTTGVQSTLYGVYDRLQEFSSYYGARMVYYGSVRGDMMQARQAGKRSSLLYETNYKINNTPEIWSAPYKVIRQANNLIAGVEKNNFEQKSMLSAKGQALTMRALAHFDLLRVYGEIFTKPTSGMGIPIVTSPLAPEVQSKRNTVPETYTQIIKDLTDAIPLLGNNKSTGFINVWAAKALLARVYLYQGSYEKALSSAEDVIDNGGYTLWKRNEYVAAWSKQGTSEVIFEIVNFSIDDNVDRESVGYLYDEDGYDDIVNTPKLLALFDDNDIRSEVSVISNGKIIPAGTVATEKQPGSNSKIFCDKFPGRDYIDVRVNNVPVLRLSEMHLIAAESAFHLGDNTKATEHTNVILERANTKKTPYATVTIDIILTEKALEFYGEGHRFFDLLRNDKEVDRSGTNRWDYILANKDANKFTADYFRSLLPIPKKETDANPEIAKQQNPEYKI